MVQFCFDCKNFDDQGSLGRPRTVDSKAVFQVIEANPVSRTWRVSVKLGISVQYGSSPSRPWQ